MPILILKAGYLKVVDKFLCGRPKAIDSLDYKGSLQGPFKVYLTL